MTRGQDYLRLLRMEYEDLVKIARTQIASYRYYMEHYTLTPDDIQNYLDNIRFNEMDIKQYGEALELLGGAENEDTLTESIKDSESPRSEFVGINCTTVL